MTLQPLSARRYAVTVLAWLALWLVVAAAALVLGARVWVWESSAQMGDALRDSLYGVATASVVGGALALAGLAFQALLRNPLASPYILGVSGGASLGVILSSLFVSVLLQPIFGFVGALATVGTVYAIAQRRGRIEPYTLLLSGVILNAFYAAVIMLTMGLVKPETRGDIAYWMMGNIGRFDLQWGLVGVVAVLAVGAAVVFAFLAKGFNLIAVGEETAGTLGVRVERVRHVTFVVASLVTGAAVALTGPIGFVGLIVPHLLRMVVGPDHRRLVPASFFFGATFLVLANLATGLLEGAVAPFPPPPVGVLTAMCGGPFFVYLLRTRWRRTAEVQ